MKVVLPVPFFPMMIFTSSRKPELASLTCQNPEITTEVILNMLDSMKRSVFDVLLDYQTRAVLELDHLWPYLR
jgi:hypothetical protein